MSARPRTRGWEWLLIAALTAGAAFLRWRQLGEQGLWLDEAMAHWMADRPLLAIPGAVLARDTNPPLHHLLLGIWLRAFGDGEGALRSLSALLSTATVPVVYLLARRLLGRAPAVAATLLVVISPFHVRFAQEARMYALLAFNASLALLALAYLLTGDRRRRWWGIFVLFSALTLLSHSTAVLYLFAVNAAVAAAALLARREAGRPALLALPRLRDWLLAQGAIVLIWALWLPSYVVQVRRVDADFWIPAPTLRSVVGAAATMLGYFDSPQWMGLWLAAVVALLLGVVALAHRPALLALVALLVVVPFAAELLVSLRRPIFYPRTLIWTSVPLFVLAAAGLGRARTIAIPSAAAIGVLVAANLVSLQAYYDTFTKEQWREAAAYVAAHVGENDTLLFHAPYVQVPFDYYFSRASSSLANHQVAEHGVPRAETDKMTEADVPALRALVEDAECVWLIYSHEQGGDPTQIVPRVLGEERALRGIAPYVGLELQLYARRGGSPCGPIP
jgi:mannosyltransferase